MLALFRERAQTNQERCQNEPKIIRTCQEHTWKMLPSMSGTRPDNSGTLS
jgi:hypothetical protein